MSVELANKTDDELIALYRGKPRNEIAMSVLVRRYHAKLVNYFTKKTYNREIAEELSQDTWRRMVVSLHRYKDKGIFERYLFFIGKNVFNSFYKSKSRLDNLQTSVYVDSPAFDSEINPEHMLQVNQAVEYLYDRLIPALPPEQRLAWLLRQESEYGFDKHHPLQWSFLAKLNGVDVSKAWTWFSSACECLLSTKLMFEATHEIYMHALHSDSSNLINDYEKRVFLEWSYAQHPSRISSFSWDHFADGLGIEVPEAWCQFNSARATLVKAKHLTQSAVGNNEMLVFLVWSQANSPKKDNNPITWSELADLVGVPEDTIKYRYHTALKKLRKQLKTQYGEKR